jgi:hypothetical protein
MPQLGTTVVDQRAVKLLREWILQLEEVKEAAETGAED